jgi:hypothetical protein
MKLKYIKPELEIVEINYENAIAVASPSHKQQGDFTGGKVLPVNDGNADDLNTGGQSDDGGGSRSKGSGWWD